MKTWKQAVIIAAICSGILVSPWIALQIQQSMPRSVSGAEWRALSLYPRVMMSRPFLVNDTALDFEIGLFQGGSYGISATGGYVDPYSENAVVVVNQYAVTLSAFEHGTILDGTNAVLDVTHRCVIFLVNGQYIALVIAE